MGYKALLFLVGLLVSFAGTAWDRFIPPVESPHYSVRLVGWKAPTQGQRYTYELSVLNRLAGTEGVLVLHNDTAFMLPGGEINKALRIYENFLIMAGWAAHSEVINVADLERLNFVASFRAMSHSISPNGRFVMIEAFRPRITPPEGQASVLSLVDLSDPAMTADGEGETQFYAGRVVFPEGSGYSVRDSDASNRYSVVRGTWLWSDGSDRVFVVALSDGAPWLLSIGIDEKRVSVRKQFIEDDISAEKGFFPAEQASWSQGGDIVISFWSFGDSHRPNLVIPIDRNN